jgi:hypothetical protein
MSCEVDRLESCAFAVLSELAQAHQSAFPGNHELLGWLVLKSNQLVAYSRQHLQLTGIQSCVRVRRLWQKMGDAVEQVALGEWRVKLNQGG